MRKALAFRIFLQSLNAARRVLRLIKPQTGRDIDAKDTQDTQQQRDTFGLIRSEQNSRCYAKFYVTKLPPRDCIMRRSTREKADAGADAAAVAEAV